MMMAYRRAVLKPFPNHKKLKSKYKKHVNYIGIQCRYNYLTLAWSFSPMCCVYMGAHTSGQGWALFIPFEEEKLVQ